MILSRMAKSFLLVAVVLVASAPFDRSQSATPPRVVGACNPTKVKFALSTHDTGTASTSPVNITETGMNFTQAKTGCVIVDFPASTGLSDPPPGAMFIRAVLTQGGGEALTVRPEMVRLSFSSSDFDTRTLEFVFPNVTPGSYVLRMQVNSSNGGGVSVDFPNTVVRYD
jgi:hypothetical protein